MPNFTQKSFKPGVDRILYAQAVFDQEEIDAVVESLKSGWLGPGKYTQQFEEEVAKLFGKKYGLFVNSGSSANLIAVEIANLPAGSEVITQACTFPTTLSPIVFKGLRPVFVDSKLGTYNIDEDRIEEAITPKTKAVFISHMLGNVNDMEKIAQICKKYNLLFVEDSCDIHGGKFGGLPTGYWSDITTTSFYAPHPTTAAGAGGMVMTNDENLIVEARILNDWGRVLPGTFDENFEERFNYQIEDIDYDGKFIFSKLGYNFKAIDLQAAFGLVQLQKLKNFNDTRTKNFQRLYNFFKNYQEHFILPQMHPKAEVYWLTFPLTIRPESTISRKDLLAYLETNKIQTRVVYAGNILLHPAFKEIPHRVSGVLENANLIARQSFVVGCHQGMSDEQMSYMCEIFTKYLEKLAKPRKKPQTIYQAL